MKITHCSLTLATGVLLALTRGDLLAVGVIAGVSVYWYLATVELLGVQALDVPTGVRACLAMGIGVVLAMGADLGLVPADVEFPFLGVFCFTYRKIINTNHYANL